MSVLEQFFKGELSPYENMGYPQRPEWEKLQEQAEKLESSLLSGLSEENKTLYNEIMTIRLQADFMEIMRAFTYGFKLGCKMITDVYNGD